MTILYTAIEWFSLCFFLLLVGFLQKNFSRKFLLRRLVLHTLAKIFEGFTFLSEFCVSEEGYWHVLIM